jgi:DNA topoisomerase VI subunit B
LGNRGKGQGYRQLNKTDEDINEYVREMANHIALFLENENVKLNESISIIKYKNIDTGAKTDMVQITFDLTKK